MAHILIVDDEEGIREFIADALEDDGHEATQAPDGLAALHHLRTRSFDLLITDLRMPGKDGFEVLQELKSREEYRSIPIIMLTSSTAEADIIKGYGLGSNSYVSKPVTFDEMVTKLGKLPSYWARTNILPPKRRDSP